jgi:hypothetical protein
MFVKIWRVKRTTIYIIDLQLHTSERWEYFVLLVSLQRLQITFKLSSVCAWFHSGFSNQTKNDNHEYRMLQSEGPNKSLSILYHYFAHNSQFSKHFLCRTRKIRQQTWSWSLWKTLFWRQPTPPTPHQSLPNCSFSASINPSHLYHSLSATLIIVSAIWQRNQWFLAPNRGGNSCVRIKQVFTIKMSYSTRTTTT